MKPLNEMIHIVSYQDVGKPFITLEDAQKLVTEIEKKDIVENSSTSQYLKLEDN